MAKTQNSLYKKYATWSGMTKSSRDELNILPKSRTIPTGSNKLKPIIPNNSFCQKKIYDLWQQFKL